MDKVGEIIKAIQNVCGSKPISLHEPKFSEIESNLIQDCIDSTYVSSVGKYTKLLEDKICFFTGAKYSSTIVNGTSALHLALICLGVKKNDEVLIPSLTFIATANAVSYCGAFPHFIDIDEKSLGIDPLALKEWLLKSTIIKDNKCINKFTSRTLVFY